MEYISPTSYLKWCGDKTEFYLQYLAASRPPRPAQTVQMAVGSAFDAYVKTALLSGDMNLETLAARGEALYAAQVEEQHREHCRVHGLEAMRTYIGSGACARMALLMHEATDIQLEGDLKVSVTHAGRTLPFRGKPDVSFRKQGVPVILDWKVNGFFSTSSPVAGYVWCSPLNRSHKDAVLGSALGVSCDMVNDLSTVKEEWAVQLAIYGWCLGVPVGEPILCGIDQITNRGGLRVSQYRNYVGAAFQLGLWDRLTAMWDDCSDVPGFCGRNGLEQWTLDSQAKGFTDPVINKLCRPNRMW